MDTSDEEIEFDENDICNHCHTATEKLKQFRFGSDIERQEKLNEIVQRIKTSGKNKQYDCIIGLSGGIDSSYLAWIVVKKLGLNPLAVHVDNGWNSELAVQNIENIVKKLNIDLHTWVIDWEEFKDLQKAFLKASVIDLEMLSDNAIVIAIKRLLQKYNIKYFLIGYNYQAESIMPSSWLYAPKYDSLNIKSIYKKFGSNKKLSTYPLLSFTEFILYHYFNRSVTANILDLVPYEKDKAVSILHEELGWRNYGGKHYESKITQFYQAYILPKKFNVDKRRAHLSSLIISEQISRQEAINELEKPLYDDNKLREDKAYFLKKLELTEKEFDDIMKLPVKSHLFYPSYKKKIINLVRFLNFKRITNSKFK